MKVTKVNAFKSEDSSIWETEEEAIAQNIKDCICLLDHDCGEGSSNISYDIMIWFKENPKEVKYILANINKIDIDDHV